MRLVKGFFRFLFSRRLWVFIGIVLLCWLIWTFGPIVRLGDLAPLETELSRLIAIGAVVILWLFSILLGQLRAARANQVFVTELARPAAAPVTGPGEGAVGEINAKFQGVLQQMKRSKLGHRRFLRDMPWYVFIGPPGTGKTTALKQSGLRFPLDLGDDLKGVGGTRNCDWFFTDEAVLVDTAGRYTEQGSHAEADAREWAGFLDLLKKHRGRRALNGVIVALSLRELLGPRDELRAHGREIRKRLAELRERLALQLPVYLMLTKLDLLPGFEPFFAELSQEEREQVWGATLPLKAAPDGALVERELRALAERTEGRLAARLADDLPLSRRADIFRFPAALLKLEEPLKLLVDTVFGENRYDEAPWLRGLYLTSATQEGSPIDRLVSELAEGFGLPAQPPPARWGGERRSFFLRRLLTDVIFREAGLGVFDARTEARRRWVWRGTLAGSALVAAGLIAVFAFSFNRYNGLLAEQERRLLGLQERLAQVAARQAPTDPLDLDLALAAMEEVEAARVVAPASLVTALGPTAEAELAEAQRIARERASRNILEPRMVALLEATLWRQVRDPDYLLGALKTYFMMTGLAPYDRAFAEAWWQDGLPGGAPIDPFPSDAARAHQLAALDRLGGEEEKIESDAELVPIALQTLCEIPLAVRAYNALLSDPTVTALPEWTPAAAAGPNGPRVFTRLSGRTLQAGLPGAFTYRGFHEAVLPLLPEVAAQAAIDRLVFAGGCDDSAEADAVTLEAEILRLYQQDYVDRWDAFLRDIRLAPLTDLATATANLKDLSSAESALRRLLVAVVAETDLARPPAEEAEGGGAEVPPGLVSAAVKRLGSLGRLARAGARVAPSGGGDAPVGPQGEVVSEHFRPIKTVVETVDDQPPKIDAVVAALLALANELQAVAASPEPEEVLRERGGLGELVGAISDAAVGLPDPIDDWIGGAARETGELARVAVVDQLNARLVADVLPFCSTATAGRYPFDPASSVDVTLPDFQRLFGPGGILDGFTTTDLLPYVDTTQRPWAWRADFGIPNDSLAPFEKARAIRDALFPGGAGPVLSFALEPKDLSPNASRVTLNVDGQLMVYFNAATRPQQMTWPGPDGTNLVSLSFAPIDGSAEAIATETGPWAFLRFVRKGSLSATDQPDLFRLDLALPPFSAAFDLRAASVENPFDLRMFEGFRCPERL